jgi:lipoprotein-anchoring transpeptidase ErfK/SrfK
VRRAGFILCLTLVCALGAGAAPLLADDTPGPAATIADGVQIGPVAVGGMTAEQAAAAVVEAYRSPLSLSIAQKTLTVSPRRFHLVAPVADAVTQALAAAPGTTIGLRAQLDAPSLASYLSLLAKRYRSDGVDSQVLLHGVRPFVTKARPGYTLRLLPARVLIRNALRDGTRTPLALPTRPLEPTVTPATIGPVIVIRRGDNMLSLFRGAKLVRTFQVATGQAAYPTPVGSFQIVVMWRNPWWYPPDSPWAAGEKPVPPGPGNPLGTRWMGLSAPGVGIHGTPDDASVGYSLSHGCIRMHISQAEWLFNHVSVGTPVFIVSA